MAIIDLAEGIKYIPSGNTVDLGGMGPCTGLIIHDAVRRQAYAGHFVDARSQYVSRMVSKALSELGSENLTAYAVGNSVIEKEDLECSTLERAFVEDLLRQRGFSRANAFIRWSPQRAVATFKFDVDTGENELRVARFNNPEKVAYQGNIRNAPNPIVF